MAGISSIGVGSGLPLDELLSNLRKAENVALTRISDQKTLAQSRVSAYGVIKSAMENLSKAAEALGKTDTFSATKPTVSGDAFTAATKAGAIPGSYEIKVNTLASAQTLVAQGQASRTASNGGGGVITIELADGTEKTLDLTGKDTSLNGIVAAINQADLGVQATMINDGSGTPHRLMLTAKSTGTEAAVARISVADADGNPNADTAQLEAILGFQAGVPSPLQENAATDASLEINGIAITSGSNTIADVIEGVTLTLSKTTDTPQTLTVAADKDAAKTAVEAFVTAYNALQSTISGLTKYDVDSQNGSVLTGDSVARSVQSRARGIINVSIPDGAVANLAQIGITTNPTNGSLQIDSEKLTKALTENAEDVARLFAGEDGIAARTKAAAEPIVSSTGLLATATDGAKNAIKDLEKQYERTELRIEATIERYRQQFVQLDAMVSQMSGISSYLTQQLGMLSTNNSQK